MKIIISEWKFPYDKCLVFSLKVHPRLDFIKNYKNKENVSNISKVYALYIFQMYTNFMRPCAIAVL